MNRDQIKEHLVFAAELGVEGVSRDPAWRQSPSACVSQTPASPALPAPPAYTPVATYFFTAAIAFSTSACVL